MHSTHSNPTATPARWKQHATLGLLAIAFCTGCRSPYAADRMALGGAGLCAVTGAVIGQAAGKNPLAGAAIGGVVGAVAGGAVGNAVDENDARNRALIEARMRRQVPAGAVTIPDIMSMQQAGVEEDLIVNHIRANGMASTLQTQDLISLQQAGVSKNVIAAMQSSPPRSEQVPERPVVVREPVIVEHYDPYWHRPYYYRRHHHHCPPPHIGVGVVF